MKRTDKKNNISKKNPNEKLEDRFDAEKENLITLTEIARHSPFSKSYISAAAREGKIRAVKIGNVWRTTQKWMNEFAEEMKSKKNEYRNILSEKTKEIIRINREDGKAGIEVSKTKTPNLAEKKEIVWQDKKTGSDGDGEERAKRKRSTKKILTFLFQNGFAVVTTLFVLVIISFVNNNSSVSKRRSELFVVNDASKQGTVMGEEDFAASLGEAEVSSSEHFIFSQVTFGGDIAVAKEETGDLGISEVKSELISSKNQGDTRLLVSWKTLKPAICEIEYGKNGEQKGKVKKEDQYSFSHSAVLSPLDPATAYNFVIKAEDKWGNEKTSDKFAFYSGSPDVSLVELLANAARETFGWAVGKR